MTRNGLSALLLNLAAFCCASVAAGDDWATKIFETTRHDYGQVARGAKTQFEFVLKNVYLEDVHIASVRSSCRCTRVSITEPTLKTYQQGAIVADINTAQFSGHKPATITVTFDRPRYAQVQLQTDVTIRTNVVIEPGAAGLGTVDQGSAVEQKVTVTRTGKSDWRILEVKSTNPHISGEAVETQRDRGRVSYELSVRLDPTTPAGYLRDHLLLVTNDRVTEQVPLPVEAVVQAPIVVSPASLFMGVVQPGQKVTKPLVVRGKKPFRITAVHCDDACFQFDTTAEGEPKSLHLLPVTFVAGESPGKVLQTIRIETDLAEEPAPELSAYAVVSP